MVLPTSTDCAAYMYVYNRNIVFTSYKVDVAFLRIKLKCRFESFFSMNPLTLNIVSLTINQSFDPSGNYRFCNELQLSHPHFCESTRRTKHWSRQSTFDDKSTVAGSRIGHVVDCWLWQEILKILRPFCTNSSVFPLKSDENPQQNPRKIDSRLQ